MDNVLTRLVNLKWYVYNRPEIAIEILKQISIEIQKLLHERMIKNCNIRTFRRIRSMPNICISWV